jgi:prepilin-type N-terminal cleavage/methylation domain-containing protein
VSKFKRDRRGFTLAEVLVTVAIIALLAAALVPIVAGQLRRGDVTRVSSDLAAVRTALEAFLADVRRVPLHVEHLMRPLEVADTDINGNAYPAGLRDRWAGPYLNREQLGSQKNVPTGFGGVIRDSIETTAVGGVNWATVVVDSLLVSEFNSIDLAVDGEANSSTGKLRYSAGLLRFLAVPIN